MNWILKSFEDLNTKELYSFLQLRSEVFVVEQDCIYQDLDGWDEKAKHLFFIKDDECIAYSRLFAPDVKYPNSSSIGRVVVRKEDRGNNLGEQLMQKSIEHLTTSFPDRPITISAQCYLDTFYKELGFIKEGEEYLEDGIPHQKMVFIKR